METFVVYVYDRYTFDRKFIRYSSFNNMYIVFSVTPIIYFFIEIIFGF